MDEERSFLILQGQSCYKQTPHCEQILFPRTATTSQYQVLQTSVLCIRKRRQAILKLLGYWEHQASLLEADYANSSDSGARKTSVQD